MTAQGESERLQRLPGWPRHLLLPTVLAYRTAAGEGDLDGPAQLLAQRACLAAGGNRTGASRAVALMTADVSALHGDWFWEPAQRRIKEVDRWWKAQGQWPPPKNPAEWPDHLRPKDRLP
jgi:hypothetical protein